MPKTEQFTPFCYIFGIVFTHTLYIAVLPYGQDNQIQMLK